jgi:hypothetical protein
MNILINAFGIVNSGGVAVLEKIFDEFFQNQHNHYIFICNNSEAIIKLADKHKDKNNFEFKFIFNNGLLHRMYFENFIFKEIVNNHRIDLIYNFSGTKQFFINTPQLIKIHNLLFYSKKLDDAYKLKSQFILWIKQIFFKRIIFKFMLKRSKHIEIQSSHVKSCLLDV